jgi:hypothetical protein
MIFMGNLRWFNKFESVTVAQLEFCCIYGVPGTHKYYSIMKWYHMFEETGCITELRTGGREPWPETEALVRATITQSSNKSLRLLSLDLGVPYMT